MEVRRDSASGLITSKKLFNTEVKYFYDSTYGELQKISYFYLGKDIYTRQFKRDLLGRIIEENDGQPKSIFYDRAGRLLGRSDKASGKPFSNYQYDKNGNRILSEENGTVQSATYDDQDRLLSFGANTYSYDANGNISSKVDGSLTLTQYVYDSDGTLAAVNMPGKTIWYGTDNEGRRIEKKVNGVKVENYIWDGLLRLVAVTNSSGVIQKRFIYSDSHSPDYMVDSQGATYLFVTDHRGSVVAVVHSNTGQVVQSLRYTEWGAIVSDSNPGFQPFGFAGGLYDLETKLLRFGARNYDPEVGRWTSKDPILFGGGDTNLYGYVMQDPVNLIDPSGLYWFRQPWQDPGVVGRDNTIVPPAPGGQISNFIERFLPAGYTFGVNHDRFVDWATAKGAPDWLVNIPSMMSLYGYSVVLELLRSLGIIAQPSPPIGTMCK